MDEARIFVVTCNECKTEVVLNLAKATFETKTSKRSHRRFQDTYCSFCGKGFGFRHGDDEDSIVVLCPCCSTVQRRRRKPVLVA